MQNFTDSTLFVVANHTPKFVGFFVKVEKTFTDASELKLPKEVVTKIELLQKDFKMTAVADVVKRMNALLFPGGANQGFWFCPLNALHLCMPF